MPLFTADTGISQRYLHHKLLFTYLRPRGICRIRFIMFDWDFGVVKTKISNKNFRFIGTLNMYAKLLYLGGWLIVFTSTVQDALKFVVFIPSLFFLNKDRPTQAIYKPRSRPRGDADDSGARNPGTFIYTRFLKIVILAYV